MWLVGVLNYSFTFVYGTSATCTGKLSFAKILRPLLNLYGKLYGRCVLILQKRIKRQFISRTRFDVRLVIVNLAGTMPSSCIASAKVPSLVTATCKGKYLHLTQHLTSYDVYA